MDRESEQGSGGAGAGGGEPQRSPLSAVYPGEYVTLESIPRVIEIRPWGVRQLQGEMPGMVGRLMGKLQPVFQAARLGLGNEAMLEALMLNAGDEIVQFVGWTAHLSAEELDVLSASDFLRLARAVLRQNRSFFDELAGVYQDFGRQIPSGVGASG